MLIRLIIAAVIAVIISGFYAHYNATQSFGYTLDFIAMATFASATILTVLLGSIGQGQSASSSRSRSSSSSESDDREQGTVKWFNVSKGFGFITRENGDEIFVHYRSILGEGRRRLFDGQDVSFIVVDSDKGLQAEEVEALNDQ